MLLFFNDTATTEIYTLSLHDALPISHGRGPRDHGALPVGVRIHRRQGPAVLRRRDLPPRGALRGNPVGSLRPRDRKSTRLNSSHANISYAVFCLKKKRTPLAPT